MIEKSLKPIILCLALTLSGSIFANDSEMNVAKSDYLITKQKVEVKSIKHYRSSGGEYISFILQLGKGIDEVSTESEYMGFTFDDSKGKLNLFVDQDRLPEAMVQRVVKVKYIDHKPQVDDIFNRSFTYRIEKRMLILDFSAANRNLANH